jgi:putative tryptophan/tyrosine transport system substrate-binding protein
MKRREFIAGLGGVVVWPLTAGAQQSKTTVIGFLFAGSVDGFYFREIILEVRRGLSETGYFEGRNLAFEYRTAEGHLERLPALADNLVRLKAAAIIAPTQAPALRPKPRRNRSQSYLRLAPTRSLPDWSAALIGRAAISPALPF